VVIIVIIGGGVAAAGGSNLFASANLVDMLQRSSLLGFVAIGQTLVILCRSLDLSVGYVMALSSLIAATTMNGDPARVPLAILAVLVVAGGIGLCNGLIVSVLKVNPFIATLGVGLIIKGYLDTNYKGTSGSVPWSFQLKNLIADPSPTAPILEALKADPACAMAEWGIALTYVDNPLNPIPQANLDTVGQQIVLSKKVLFLNPGEKFRVILFTNRHAAKRRYDASRIDSDAFRTESLVMYSESGELPNAKLIRCSCSCSSVAGFAFSSNSFNSGSNATSPRNCLRSAMNHLPTLRDPTRQRLDDKCHFRTALVKNLVPSNVHALFRRSLHIGSIDRTVKSHCH
jgi:hypothetical protein